VIGLEAKSFGMRRFENDVSVLLAVREEDSRESTL